MDFADRVGALITAFGADIKTLLTKAAATRAVGYDDLVVNATATGTVTCNLAAATVFNLTLTGNTTIAFSNVPVPTAQSFSWVVRVTMGGTLRTLTMPTVTWLTPTGTYETPAVGKVIEYVFSTENGTTIFGGKGRYTS